MVDLPRPRQQVSYEDLVRWAQSLMDTGSLGTRMPTDPFSGLPGRTPPQLPQLPPQVPQMLPGPTRPAPAMPGYAAPMGGPIPDQPSIFNPAMDAVRRKTYDPLMFQMAPIPERKVNPPGGGYERFLDYTKRVT